MKLLKHSIKARILWLLASCVALLLSSPVPGFQAQKSRLEMRGKAEFNDDYMDIKDVSAGG